MYTYFIRSCNLPCQCCTLLHLLLGGRGRRNTALSRSFMLTETPNAMGLHDCSSVSAVVRVLISRMGVSRAKQTASQLRGLPVLVLTCCARPTARPQRRPVEPSAPTPEKAFLTFRGLLRQLLDTASKPTKTSRGLNALGFREVSWTAPEISFLINHKHQMFMELSIRVL